MSDHPVRGFCPYCFKEMTLKAGRMREHKVERTTRAGKFKADCKGVGAIALRVLPQDAERRRDRGQQIGHIARLHETTVQRAPELVRGARRARRPAAHQPAATPVATTGGEMANAPMEKSGYCSVCLMYLGLKNGTDHPRTHRAPLDILNTEWTSKNTNETKMLCKGYVEKHNAYSVTELNKLMSNAKRYKDAEKAAEATSQHLQEKVKSLEETIADLESKIAETPTETGGPSKQDYDAMERELLDVQTKLVDEIQISQHLQEKVESLTAELQAARQDVLANIPDTGSTIPMEDHTGAPEKSRMNPSQAWPTPESPSFSELTASAEYDAVVAENKALVKLIPQLMAEERRRVMTER